MRVIFMDESGTELWEQTELIEYLDAGSEILAPNGKLYMVVRGSYATGDDGYMANVEMTLRPI